MTAHIDQENWYLAYSEVAQTKDIMDAYANANKAFGNYDEPSAVQDWLGDAGNITPDIHAWYFSANLEHGTNPSLAAKVRDDFTAADRDIANIDAGK